MFQMNSTVQQVFLNLPQRVEIHATEFFLGKMSVGYFPVVINLCDGLVCKCFVLRFAIKESVMVWE
jgi:hypothetical protein